MSTRHPKAVDVTIGLRQLCDDLGVNPKNVRRIELDVADGITIESYRLLNGRKYTVDQHDQPAAGRYKQPDEPSAHAASETIRIPAGAIEWVPPGTRIPDDDGNGMATSGDTLLTWIRRKTTRRQSETAT